MDFGWEEVMKRTVRTELQQKQHNFLSLQKKNSPTAITISVCIPQTTAIY